jgi:hypothetical protein
MNKTPDFAGSGNDPNTTNNSQLILTNNNNPNITSNTNNNIKKSIIHSNSSMNLQLQSKSINDRISRKIKNDENNKNNIIENSYYSPSGILANSYHFGVNLPGNASGDFNNNFHNTNNNHNNSNNHGSGFSSSFRNKNTNSENTISPLILKVNNETMQIKKLPINDINSSHFTNENNSMTRSLTDKRIEVNNYSKRKNFNINNKTSEEENLNNNGNKRVLSDKLSKLLNCNKESYIYNNISNANNIKPNNHTDNNNVYSNNSNFNLSNNANKSLNNINSNFNNPGIINSKTIATDNNLSNQFKSKNYVKKVVHRSLAGKTENGSTKTNQDNFVIMENILNCEDYRIYGVFDGHGNSI